MKMQPRKSSKFFKKKKGKINTWKNISKPGFGAENELMEIMMIMITDHEEMKLMGD